MSTIQILESIQQWHEVTTTSIDCCYLEKKSMSYPIGKVHLSKKHLHKPYYWMLQITTYFFLLDYKLWIQKLKYIYIEHLVVVDMYLVLRVNYKNWKDKRCLCKDYYMVWMTRKITFAYFLRILQKKYFRSEEELCNRTYMGLLTSWNKIR